MTCLTSCVNVLLTCIVRSQTGSGKTAAYALPIIHSILQKKTSSHLKTISVLILVPTRELAQQVAKAITSFCSFCTKEVRTVNITQKTPGAVQRTLLAELPDIVVATPATAAQNLKSEALSLDSIATLVIDEADLVLSYGYDEDLQTISQSLPNGIRTSLISATLTPDIVTLKGLFCRDAVILDLKELTDGKKSISQYAVRCAEDEKFLLSYVMFKLKLIKGKCLIFVGDIDRCYRLKLFFEQFGIRSCVLNSGLPVNSRIHVVEEFNKGIYDIIIASDEHEAVGTNEDLDHAKASVEDEAASLHGNGDDTHSQLVRVSTTQESDADIAEDPTSQSGNTRARRKGKKIKRDKEYGVSRGIDFQNVVCVFNFDFPASSKSYTHRIGRTARAGKTGMALSFVVPRSLYRKHKPTSFPTCRFDEDILAEVEKEQQGSGKEILPYHFDMAQVSPFQYRMADALRAVTRLAVREARTRELRQELLKSEKLKQHFEDNPEDLNHLRHDGELRAARIQPHLRHVPDYLMPVGGNRGITKDGATGEFIGLRKETDNRIRKARMRRKGHSKGVKSNVVRKLNPLKSFKVSGKR